MSQTDLEEIHAVLRDSADCPPQPYDPNWTELAFAASGGRDALGVETLGEAILSDLLPGINNQTSRARYYSFWAWVLREFIRDTGAQHTQQGFYQWLRKRENMLILAYLAHGCSSGIAGTNQGHTIWQDGELEAYSLTWKPLLSVEGGAYQLYYRGSLMEMHIIHGADSDHRHDALVENIGTLLADAYGEAVSSTVYVRQYLDATQVTRPIIEEYAERGCICQVSHHEKERQALIDVFFRFDSPDTLAVRRIASLSLFLDIIHQSQDEPLTDNAFRDVFYYWSFGDSHPYQPQGNLIEPAQRWRLFQMRQWFVFAIESPWSLFLHQIEIAPLSEDEYLAWLLENFDLSSLAEEMGIPLEDADIDTVTVRQFYTAVREAMPDVDKKTGHVNLENSLNERTLSSGIRRRHTQVDPQVRLGHALLMLSVLYWRVQPWIGQPGWHFLSDREAAGRLPMENYLRHVDQAIEEEWTLARWIRWLHQRYLWQQHRRVVLEKLAGSGKDTSMFGIIDEPGDEGRCQSRMRALNQDNPKMNAPRFPSALRIFTDLTLIEPLQNGGYRLLPDAEALLERFKQYATPSAETNDVNETASGPESLSG